MMIYGSNINNPSGIRFVTCYGIQNCWCPLPWLKVMGYGSKEFSWHKKKNFEQFLRSSFLDFSWVFPETSGKVHLGGSE
jgi:hypothetical protein